MTAAAFDSRDARSAAEREVDSIYASFKDKIRSLAEARAADECCAEIAALCSFMNRLRNCDLDHYFDEELHRIIQSFNEVRFDVSPLLREKSSFRIAFVFNRFNDTGGAAFTHRFILEEPPTERDQFQQYVLVTNPGGSTEYQRSERYEYLRDHVRCEEFHFMEPCDSYIERGCQIERWLFERQIDFAFVQPEISSIYALASRPVPISGTFSADWHTFTLGPGVGDFTFLMTTDQAYKYRLREPDFERRFKVAYLTLPPKAYAESGCTQTRREWGVPDDAIVAATTNMWKCCFGDNEVLLEGIAALMRRFPRYYHLFVGTPRCLDSVEHFLSRNPDLKGRIRYVGPQPRIYDLLRGIDFYVNSYPVSGASNTESALVSRPSIDLCDNRDLNGHGTELLRTRECEAFSISEFLELGERLLGDGAYRRELGKYVQSRVERELSKPRVVADKIYRTFSNEFRRRLDDRPRPPGLGLRATLDYELRMGLYNAWGRREWDVGRRRRWLEECTEGFPERSFGWVKLLELAVETTDRAWLEAQLDTLGPRQLRDHRVRATLAVAADRFGDRDAAIEHGRAALECSLWDPIPARIGARLLFEAGRPEEAVAVCRARLPGLGAEELTSDEVREALKRLPADDLPLYYDY